MMGILPSYSAASSSHTEYFHSQQRRSAPVGIGKTQLRLQPAGHWQACGGVPRNAHTILILEAQWA